MSGYTSAGDFLVSQVAGCRCTLLAGNSSISLAGSEDKRINFSQHITKCLNGFRKLCSCFVVVFRSFSQNFPLGAPELSNES